MSDRLAVASQRNRYNRTLVDISDECIVVLLDTCIMFSQYPNRRHNDVFKRSFVAEENRRQAVFLRRFLEEGRDFYVTQGVLDEYRNPSHTVLQGIKVVDGEVVDFIKTVWKENVERRNLVDYISEIGRIIRLNPADVGIYKEVASSHPRLASQFELSSPDLDLLLTSVALSRRVSTALVSNDNGIRGAFRYLGKNGEFQNRDLKHFSRSGYHFQQNI